MLCLGSIFFLGFGLLCVFAKDVIWEWNVQSNKMKGVASERSEMWDLTTTISGVVSIILGLVSLYIYFQGG